MHSFGHIFWQRQLYRLSLLRESRAAMVGTGLVLFWIFVAIAAPILTLYDPIEQIKAFQKPLTRTETDFFILGTDGLGRDLWSRMAYGGRRMLLYSVTATGCAYIVGISFGLMAGYYRGWTDRVLSFIANVILSFPVIALYVLIVSNLGASGLNVVFAVVFASSPAIFRIVRALTLDLRQQEYVAAAQTRGEKGLYIMFVEILPNASGPLIVDGCLRLGYTTIAIGVLGFLGLGLPPPSPDWGGIINENRQLAIIFPHAVVFPVLALSSFILGLNLLADGISEIAKKD